MSKIRKLITVKLLLQFFFLTLSFFLIAEGLWGNQFAPKNLTAQFVWVHYRALLVLTLLFWGNAFCMSCPFIFTRNLLRVLVAPKLLWPKQLQNKWLGLFLFVAVLFSYEYFGLWSSPALTTYLIIGYFAAAIIIDLTFKKASFCKYVCPIGQFNFLTSTLSPKVVKAKDLSVCETCTTYDCLKGRTTAEEDFRGCETSLLIPKKHGSLDCTFCLDCVSACPYHNVEIGKAIPSEELWEDTHRSGVGSITERLDFVALMTTFVFSGLLNAFMMTGPSYVIREKAQAWTGINSPFTLTLIPFFLFLIPLPLILLSPLEIVSRTMIKKRFKQIPTLLPMGVSIWCAHYAFHFLTGAFTFIPILTGIALPIKYMGLPTRVVTPIEVGILFLGFLGSSLLAIKRNDEKRLQYTAIVTNAILFALALWILTLPMEMRGTYIGISTGLAP